MACNKGIAIAFCGFGKSRHTAVLPKGGKIRLAAGQQLMNIRLMTYIKHQTVLSCIKHGLNGNCQLHNASIGCHVAAGSRYIFNKKRPQFTAKKLSLFITKRSQIPVAADIFQNTHK